MNPDAPRPDLLPATTGTPVLAAILAGLVVLWFLLHWLKRFPRRRPLRALLFLLRVAFGAATLWLAFQIAARHLYLASNWPLAVTAALGAATIETIVALYARERRNVTPAAGRMVVALRIAAVLLVLAILLQPVLTRDLERRFQREVVVLLDDSASMHFSDAEPTVSEQLKVAALFGIQAASRELTLTEALRRLRLLDSRLRIEAQALNVPEGVSGAAANALVARRINPLRKYLVDASGEVREIQRVLAGERDRFQNVSNQTRAVLSDYDKRVRDNIAAVLDQASAALATEGWDSARRHLDNAARQIRYVVERLPDAIGELDRAFFESLPEADRQLIASTARKTRNAIAREVLHQGRDEEASILDRLGESYRLRFLRFGDGAADLAVDDWLDTGKLNAPPAEKTGPESGDGTFRERTDFTSALETIMEKVGAGDLAGVIVLTDGRHNGERGIEDAVRRMALQDAPVCSVAIGSTIGPKDASVVDVRVPEAIYLDDRAVIQADLKLDGLAGETVKVILYEEDIAVAEQDIAVPKDDRAYRTTARFTHVPQEKGIFKYRVSAASVPGELLADNNDWNFEVAVTDDRTNVLLIDGYPRWEFRYLRNLFFARDKSVHLQYVLMNPDQIEGAPPVPAIPASTSRPFGNAEATRLPATREEWLKFDAIIIGDVSPTVFTDADLLAIHEVVRDRAGLLVCIAGPRYMPHAFTADVFRDLLPITYDGSARTRFNSPEPAYRLRLTAEGRASLIMRQSEDPELNDLVWASLPPLLWRYQPAGVKEGAEVLAWAEPVDTSLDDGSTRPAPPPRGDAFDDLAATREMERAGALIVSQRYALGRTLMLNFDRTWRLRYGVGDLYHHKFWGQILRWASGENLRAGNDFVRLGTDKLTYNPGKPVKVIAKLLNEHYIPATNATVTVSVSRDNKAVVRKQLRFRPDSNGIYEAVLDNLPGPGRYRLELDSPEASAVLAAHNLPNVETAFLVEEPNNQIELSDLTANPPFLESLASLSGGAVADPDNANALLDFLGNPGKIIRERREASLWDNLPFLAAAFALVTAEWLVRRKAGLN